MKYRLQNVNYNNKDSELALHDLLVERGISTPYEWLNPNYTYENSPILLNNMIRGVELLNKHIKNPEATITVIVDSDLDGYTSSAIILSLLKTIQRGQDIKYVLHPGKEHGIELKDRKSVVEGKSVKISVDLGGRRLIKKKKNSRLHLSRRLINQQRHTGN